MLHHNPDATREQVARILVSCDFVHAERLKRFLTFIVDETLAGRGDRLKAYAVALGVFDRDDTFDPQADPIVRIEAGRLRRALEHYYLTVGRDDQIVITVPKGSYAPHVEYRASGVVGHTADVTAGDAPEAGATPGPRKPFSLPRLKPRSWLIGGLFAVGAVVMVWQGIQASRQPPELQDASVVLVLPFLPLGDVSASNLVSAGLAGGLVDTLAGINGLKVMGRDTTRWAQSELSLAGLRKTYGLTYVLEGDVLTTSAQVTISARLVDSRTNSIVWVHRYERPASTPLLDVQADIGAQMLATLAPKRKEAAEPYPADNFLEQPQVSWDDYACKLRFYRYRLDLTPQNHAGVRECLQQTAQRWPQDADAWAMLSLILTDDLRGVDGDGGDRTATLALSREAATRAISIAPRKPRALEAMSLADYFAGRPAEGRAAGEQALALAPYDAEILGEVGTRIAQAGEWERGRQLLAQALQLNPANAGYYAGHLAFIAYMEGDLKAASTLISRTSTKQYATRFLVEALIAAERGEQAAAEQARLRFLQLSPGFMGRLDQEIAQRNMTPADAQKLRQGLAKAGFGPS